MPVLSFATRQGSMTAVFHHAMSIRRPRGPKATLRHLPFLDALVDRASDVTASRALRAGLLTLRLFDEWITAGAFVVNPSSPALRATRSAIEELRDDVDLHRALTRVLDAIEMLQDPDPVPVLPRLAAYAELLRNRGEQRLADDIVREAGPGTHRVSGPTRTGPQMDVRS